MAMRPLTEEQMREYQQFRRDGGKETLRAWMMGRDKRNKDPRYNERAAIKRATAKPASGNAGQTDPAEPGGSNKPNGNRPNGGGITPLGATGPATGIGPGPDGPPLPVGGTTRPPIYDPIRPVGSDPVKPKPGTIDPIEPVGGARDDIKPPDGSIEPIRPVPASADRITPVGATPRPNRPPDGAIGPVTGPSDKSGPMPASRSAAPQSVNKTGTGTPSTDVTIDQVRDFADYLRRQDMSQYDAETQARVVRQLQAADRQIGSGVVNLEELGVDPSFTGDQFAAAMSQAATRAGAGGPTKPGGTTSTGSGTAPTGNGSAATTPTGNGSAATTPTGNGSAATTPTGNDAATATMEQVQQRATLWNRRMAEMEQAVINGEMSHTDYMRENQRFEAFMTAAEAGDFAAAMSAENPFDAGSGAGAAPRRDLAELNAERQRAGLRPLTQEVYDAMPERGAQQAGYRYGNNGGTMLSNEYANESGASSMPRMSQIIAAVGGDPARIQERLNQLGATDVIDDVSNMTPEQVQGHRHAAAIQAFQATTAARNPAAPATPGQPSAPTPATAPPAGTGGDKSAPMRTMVGMYTPGGTVVNADGLDPKPQPGGAASMSGSPGPGGIPKPTGKPVDTRQQAREDYMVMREGVSAPKPWADDRFGGGAGMFADDTAMRGQQAGGGVAGSIGGQREPGASNAPGGSAAPGSKIGFPSPSAMVQSARGVASAGMNAASDMFQGGVNAFQGAATAVGNGVSNLMGQFGAKPTTSPQQAAANVQGQPDPPGRTGSSGGGNFNAGGGLNSAGQAAFTGAQIAQNQQRTRQQAVTAMQNSRGMR